MADDASAYTEVGESFQGYCCMARQYFSKKSNLADTLEISPRVIIYKRRLKVGSIYQQTLYIKNRSLFTRRLLYDTDSPGDTKINVPKNKQIEDLPADNAIYVSIEIRPKEKASINRRRNILITSVHPNITFEVPIIILAEFMEWPSIQPNINFHSAVPKTSTCYESIIYNAKPMPANVVVKTLNQMLEIDVSAKTIEKHDYVKVFLKLSVKDMRMVHDVMKVKFSPTTSHEIHFMHQPIRNSLYLSTQHLQFEILKFERNTQKEFRACNESIDSPIQYATRFLTAIHDLDTETLIQSDNFEEQSLEEEEEKSVSNQSFVDKPEVITEPVYVQDIVDVVSYKHFGINSKGGQIKAKCSNKFILTFHPVMDDDEIIFNEEPPFLIASKLIFDIRDELMTAQSQMYISGHISGPEVEIKPLNIDARNIYLGEEYCEQIIAQNIDGVVNTKIYFLDYHPVKVGTCVVTPENGFILEPCKKGVFLVTLFTKLTGKFSLRLRFKVQNGKIYNIILRGSSLPVEPKMYPKILELGDIPICVPVKSRVLFMNPLAVPMTIHMRPMDDGTERPLILDVRNTTNTLPITINNPIKTVDYFDDPYDPADFPEIELTQKTPSLRSVGSMEGTVISETSIKFEEEVLEQIPEMAHRIVSQVKNMRIWEKTNVAKKMTKQAMCALMELDYFHDLTYGNYKYMNWNHLPSDPCEMYVNKEILYLQPNTGKKITFLLIPNAVGKFNRFIEIRSCPIFEMPEDDVDSELTDGALINVVDSNLMVSKLWIEYTCQVPDIEWLEEVKFDKRTIYAGEAYTFHMSFENNSRIGGFLYYDIVPGGADGEMFFVDNTWKYYIPHLFLIYAYCGVIFRKFGDVRLSGIIKIVGSQVGRPFHLTAHVLPNRVHVSVKYVMKKVRVLEESVVYIYITNITPTRTWITMSLKNEDFQYIEPEGTILGPTGQGFYVTVNTKFYDPEFYRNTLYINVRNGHMIEVPINYDVWGMPIFFEPNIKEGLNAGIILTTSEEDFNADLPKFRREIKVINRGYRFYRLTLQKTKNSPANCIPSSCNTPESKARLSVGPKNLTLPPFSEDFITITANACEETTITNEFRIEIVDQEDKKRVESIRFVVTAKFIYPELTWSKKELTIIYCRTHRQKERTHLELVKLINIADVSIDIVNLKVLGPFKARELFEHPFKKELGFKIGAAEKKELTIFLNKGALTDKFCTHVDGRILCVANDKIQRSLKLRVIIRNPELKITQSDMIFFTDNRENTAMVELENNGCLEASYKWKKVLERTEFVGENDDAKDFAREILSDIFRMLEFGECDDEMESESEHNMTLRYQKYRCKLQRCSPPDPIGVSDILTEIIDNLDLEHKRWMIRLNDEYSERNSMGSFVEKTIDRILGVLKIEDSYELSEASSECCDKERTIYFFEKMGVLNQKEKVKLLVHLPAVRKGYAHQAIFRLDVVGGTSHQLEIIAINYEKTVELSRDNIYLGMKPWYEQYKAGVKVQNVTNYTINIMLHKKPLTEKLQSRKFNRIADGFLQIATEKFFNISHMDTKLMKFTGIMGFSEEFIREIKLVINDGEERPIRLRGQGIMPIFSVMNNLPRLTQDQVEITSEYELLRRVYYFDVFRGITEEDDEPRGIPEEETEHKEIQSEVSSILSFSGSSMSSRTAERRLFKILRSYVVVVNNAELPNATILEQLLETEKFLEELKNNADTAQLLQMVYQSYVKERESYDPKIPFNLKVFTIQSLPFGLHGHVLNMGTLKINEMRKFHIDLHFYGPGKLRAAARTAIRIPGLFVDFKVQESFPDEKHDFVVYASEETEADFLKKPYRNMYERDVDLEHDPKLKHAHSFDVDSKKKHKRQPNAKERKIRVRYYNSLNKSVYMERKHHLILCKIYAKCPHNFSGTKIQVVILIKPSRRFYEDDQLIEDYIYIDLHMGPTLPILLRGMIRY